MLSKLYKNIFALSLISGLCFMTSSSSQSKKSLLVFPCSKNVTPAITVVPAKRLLGLVKQSILLTTSAVSSTVKPASVATASAAYETTNQSSTRVNGVPDCFTDYAILHHGGKDGLSDRDIQDMYEYSSTHGNEK